MKRRSLLLGGLLALGAPAASRAEDERLAARFQGAGTWLNSEPLSAAQLRGKVVLVQFWTYTCVNWLRTMPYVRAWAAKYRNAGLLVIGVHTPEFSFEHDLDNVRRAVKTMDVAYPVPTDNEYRIWRAFGNQAWPALYLADAMGRVRYSHFGEGEYERTEKMIQQLLPQNSARGLVEVEGRGLEAAADWANVRSAENYLSPGRTQGFSSAPARLALNQWALAGDWAMKDEAVALKGPNGRIAYRFHARDVNLVMGPAQKDGTVRFRVLLDGKPPADSRGGDVDAQGYGTVREQRTYQLIRQLKPIAERLFEIEFLEPGVEAFDFTFG
jgi:thiol-disulfide isomerase/thioredoxin